MSYQITSTVISGEVVVDLAGRLCFVDLSLRDHIGRLLQKGHRDFTLDMSKASYLDSFGLGQLISIRNSIQREGGQIRLLRPPAHVQKLLRITKLDTLFCVVDRERPLAVDAA
jgi:anti-sigma B factor antagonist